MFELLGEGAAQRERSRRNQEDAGQELDTVLVSKAELLERIAAAEELEQKVRLHCMVHRVVQHHLLSDVPPRLDQRRAERRHADPGPDDAQLNAVLGLRHDQLVRNERPNLRRAGHGGR